MSPEEQAQILDPLRAAAWAVDEAAQQVASDVYSGVRIDAPEGAVHLYVTVVAEAGRILDRARTTSPGVDLRPVRVHLSRYTQARLDTAAKDLVPTLGGPDMVNTISIPADGSALVVGVGNYSADARVRSSRTTLLSTTTGVEVRLRPDGPTPGADRYGDSVPFYGGAFIKDGNYACTSGIPAKDNFGGQFLITAYHCGRTGVTFRTGRNGLVGTVNRHSSILDASVIPVGSAAWIWDGPPGPSANRIRVQGVRPNVEGDLVCQNGYTSGGDLRNPHHRRLPVHDGHPDPLSRLYRSGCPGFAVGYSRPEGRQRRNGLCPERIIVEPSNRTRPGKRRKRWLDLLHRGG
ncbi:hypothetical protein [Micromonospora marina]|uniref:hypothetical protein n=1 Tax=Micromonospora marina TaxID=307120 RepID=UPI003456BF58